MNLKKNEIEIIKLLISSTKYISSYDIATATGINRRLVRDEIANIKVILKSLGYELISKTSKGYIIEGKSSHSLQALSAIIETAESQRESVFPTLPWERSNYIIKRLVEYNDYVKIDALSEELLICRSTISSDLKRAKKDIQKYGLSLKQKPNYGICIVGDEVNKRKPICDFLFTNLKESEMTYDYLNSFFADEDSLEYGIIKILKDYHVEMSDYALCDFLLSLSVSLTRILSGHQITIAQDLSMVKDRIELEAAKAIAGFIQEKIHCKINEYEINQIGIELICKRSSLGVEPKNKPETIDLVNEILDEIEERTLLHFSTQTFKKVFTLYVESALIRIFYKEKVRNPIYDTIKNAYPLAYECAEIASSVIYRHTQQHLSRSELAFFAIIFHKAIHSKDTSKKKVLLVCGLGGGNGDLCKFQILERFENQIDICKGTQYYKLSDEDLSLYDFIISTAPIHKKLSIPHINISQIITSEDLDKIGNYLSYLFNKNRMETLFHPKLYKDHVKVRSKTDIVNEFYKLLKKQYPTIKESFKNNIMIKDQSQLTHYKYGITVLKLNKPLNNNNILSVLILQQPFIYDKKEIRMIILFSCLDTNNYIYNTLTNTMMNLVYHHDDIEKLFEKPTYQSFLKTMMKYQ